MSDDFSTENEIIIPADLQNQTESGNELNDKITELSKKGYQLLKEDKIEEATQAFESILELEKNNNYALVGLGDTERKKNNLKKAIEYYNQCLLMHPTNNYALFGIADCYKSLHQYDKAIDIWKQYLVHDEKNITVITRVADAYRKVRDFTQSKELYLKVLEMEKDNAYALIGLGHLHYDFKEYRDALYYWTKIYEINQDSADIRVLTAIGNCHRKLKTFEKGTIYFKKALEKEPENFYALFGLADCYRGLNLPNESIIYWNKILEIDPNNKVILTRAGDAYRTLGNIPEATKYYTKALDIDFDIYAAIGLALICKSEGNYEEAITRFKNLIRNDPKNSRLHSDLAECYFSMNKKDLAIKTLEDYLKFDGKNAILNNQLQKYRA